MRKYLLVILSFVFQYFVLSADTYTYCYWVDENHAEAKKTTLSTNKLDATIDVSSLSPGMHTLFVRARKNNGGWSSTKASHFFKMLDPTTVKTYYWFDDNDSTRFEVAKVNGETFMIDVSHLSDGTHTLHVRMEGEGATSATVSNQFLKFTGSFDAYYWFDNEEERRDFANAGGSAMLIDVSHLKEGLHSFNAMLVSDDGSASVPVSRTFIKLPQPTVNDSTTLTFWIDGVEHSQQKVAYGNEVVDFELDVDTLSVGMHYLQVQAVTNSGSMSNIASGYFMRMPDERNEGVMAYRYWVNDDNADLAFTYVENSTLPYEFIGELDVTPQPLRCARFHFEVNDDKPMLYAVNDLTVQFFSVGGHLINAKKEFIESVAADTLTADEWTVVRRDTIIKANTPKDETIYWYAMNLEEGDTVGVKTNYSSTLQVYSHSGKKVFESKTDSSLVMRQFIAEKDETYYLALHTVNTTKSQVTLTIDINEFVRYYNVNVTATAGGSVTGGKLYLEGTDATITATPAEGYHFVRWSDGVIDATRTFTVTTDITLTAEFAINVYNVTLSAVNGTVTGAGEYQHGATANINAVAAAGYHFVRWSDGNTEATRSIVVTAAVTLTAEFAINVYTVTLNAENGTVKGAGSYNYGTDVTLTATPAEGYHFVKWSDGELNATRTIKVTAAVTLTAEFAINVYTVTLNVENGTVKGAGSYNYGTGVTLTATPAEGYHFVKWSDGELNATRTIKVTADVTLTAEFAINVYTVTLNAENGTVTGAGEYEHGTTANITTVAAEGYHFVKWSDGDTNATRIITVTADVTLTAEFAINVYNVTLGAENGVVTGAGSYNHGTEVILAATPNEGYHFVKWSDGDTNATRTIKVTSNVTLTAEFAINVYTIEATAINGTITGAGDYEHGKTVTLTAIANANCHFIGWSDGVMDLTRTFVATEDVTLTAYFASDKYLVMLSAENGTVTGAGEYEHGATANITAVAAEGYHFVRWSDGNTEATRSIVVTSNVSLTAEFAINVYTVTLSAENGTVTGAGEYNHGTEVTLTATPNEGYRFVKWSDGDTNATRTITVTADVTLTAEFA
ncbi:MAG: InlB B-repeat-containing protein, partial [Paludibacteraceae bacterium]|nr:InlB B-repeat-containing protein [Paludibacteraceae bacterium]